MVDDPNMLNPEDAGPYAGDAQMRALLAHPVAVMRPESLRVPFIFASPHSGSIYPPSFTRLSRLDALNLRKSEDAFVDELFGCASALGAPLLAARFPRVFVDVNRGPSEIDPAMFEGSLSVAVGPRTPRVAAGLGVIPRVVRDGLEIYRTRLCPSEAAFRLTHFYRPYHARLAQLIDEARAQFGVAIVVDCHSMPPPVRGPDIVLGDCYGESALPQLSLFVQKSLAQCGFSVARNTPYAGGYTTRLHGRPETDSQAIQIEISRSLYLDESRMTRTAGFPEVRRKLECFVDSLLSTAGPWLVPSVPPLAAAAE